MYIKENILELGTGQEMASKEGSLLFISLDFQCGRWGEGGKVWLNIPLHGTNQCSGNRDGILKRHFLPRFLGKN